MSLQVCGESPGLSATGAWESGRQGKALQEGKRPILNSTWLEQQEFDSRPSMSEGIGSTKLSQPPSAESRGLHPTCDSPPGHLNLSL